MLLIILLVMGLMALIIEVILGAENRARLRKELGPNFDEEVKRYRNLMKDQIDRHF